MSNKGGFDYKELKGEDLRTLTDLYNKTTAGETKKGYFAGDAGDWNDISISAGDTTDGVKCLKYKKKTIYFLSDTAGTLTVETQEPDGDWDTYDTISVDADALEPVSPTGVMEYVRLSFDTAATVTAFYEFIA